MLPLAILAVVALACVALRLAEPAVDAIRAEMTALTEENEALLKAAKATESELTEEQLQKMQANTARYDELAKELATLEAKAAASAAIAAKATAQIESARQSTGRPTPPEAADSLGKTAVTTTHNNLEDDPEGGFKSIGEMGLALFEAGLPAGEVDERLRVRAALTQGAFEQAGILVPPAHSDSIWTEAQTRSDSLVQYCTPWTVPAGNDSITVPAIAETSRADGSRWGGVQGYWKDELSQMSATNPTLRGVKLEPEELYVFVDASDKLIRNAPQVVNQLINVCAPDEINFKIGDAIINGTGAGQPRGIMNAAAKEAIVKETDQAAATFVADNALKMWARMPAAWRAGAIWFIDQGVEPQLDKMYLDVGAAGGQLVYMPPSGITAEAPGRIKGRPVVPIEYCQALGTEGDVILANLKAYAVGFKGGVRSAVSMHLYFDYARTAFRFMIEMDGQPILNSAITPKSGGDTQSTFLTTAVRA